MFAISDWVLGHQRFVGPLPGGRLSVIVPYQVGQQVKVSVGRKDDCLEEEVLGNLIHLGFVETLGHLGQVVTNPFGRVLVAQN